MDRQQWLAGRRAAVVAVYDAEAPAYDEHDYPLRRPAGMGGPGTGLIEPGGIVLDAPCGTGEERPLVLANLHRAVRPGGVMYLTVEGDVAGYHYYPGREQVVRWLGGERLTVIDEGFKWEDSWRLKPANNRDHRRSLPQC